MRIRLVPVYVALTAGAVITVLPFLYMISTAVQRNVYLLGVSFWPASPSLQNFVDAWTANYFGTFFLNSVLVAVTTTFVSVLAAAMMAYAFARFDFWGKRPMYLSLLLTLMIPAVMLVIPQFLLARDLGLLDSRTGLVVVDAAMTLSLNTYLLRGFFETLPHEIEEAAQVDGAGHFRIFGQIVLPLSRPALATVAIFTFLYAWDEYPWAVTAINSTDKMTLPIAIAFFQGQHLTQWGLVFAASLIAIIPVVSIFIFFQHYFVRGLTTGAVKL
jgi:multiple sugar transport system permease protein